MENLHLPNYTYKAKVVRIIDGDTIVLDIDMGFNAWLHNEHVRLMGIDTPEVTGAEKVEGLKAKAFVANRVAPGDTVMIETVKDTKGKYGRYLATIWLVNDSGVYGYNLNEALVASGNAVVANY